MNDEINYQNNPLHGVSLKNLLIEMVDHYGFEILFAYLNINCFKTNPSVESSVKFLKKTDWAREKVESFYLYEYKNLPRASASQFALPPRTRLIPEGQVPGEPAKLSLEDAARLREKREKKAATRGAGPRPGRSNGPAAKRGSGYGPKRNTDSNRQDKPRQESRASSAPASAPATGAVDPWAHARK